MTKSGFVALIGRPNVGKSTLLNYLVGEKISITSSRPQTTRNKILGIKTIDNVQLLFVDTPGMHTKAKKSLNKFMNKEAEQALNSIDAVVFLVDSLKWTEDDDSVLSKIVRLKCPVILGINKVDTLKDKKLLLECLQKYSKLHQFAEIIPLSAKRGTHIDKLLAKLADIMPEGPHYYPEEQVTDRSINFRLAEIVREKLTRFLGAELPYSLSVVIESLVKKEDLSLVTATIWVERDSQKKIIIGKKGTKLKEIGTAARLDISKVLQNKVHLNLWVKVKAGWANDPKEMHRLGYFDNDIE